MHDVHTRKMNHATMLNTTTAPQQVAPATLLPAPPAGWPVVRPKPWPGLHAMYVLACASCVALLANPLASMGGPPSPLPLANPRVWPAAPAPASMHCLAGPSASCLIAILRACISAAPCCLLVC
eukprot:CAMPEP_0202879216 /NCGR_PEP_ID=MMETSP1391-20130828/33311_1 /ASSEMBLY_ACC=CAM_ASM_000867 /TAXON_ID=1034604 /ORGANISM="Chlamydomonas leiostraca, Strain SAG 11-49" /LENGTH=123 /DNA_ID=CAMNT_0049561531 /DNA_START=186 /DNA_END=557 /DNA_ORIENTATION=+